MGFLTGKTAIITGAGRAVLSDGRCGSIGYGIATAYAKEGANLVITGRNVKKLEAAKEELERLYHIQVLIVQADVNAGADNEAVVANVVKQTIDTFGSIDVLINNAQASASGVPLAEHTTDQFNLALYSGLYAAFYYMKACYPYLAKSKGSVINFASGAGLFGNFGQCAYAAAKEGIRGLTRVAATEWAKDGINVNIICPLAWTAQLEQFEKAYPDAFEANVKMPPAGHYGDSELEIGRVCVQLASPDFKYLTGETLTLEGGMGLRPSNEKEPKGSFLLAKRFMFRYPIRQRYLQSLLSVLPILLAHRQESCNIPPMYLLLPFLIQRRKSVLPPAGADGR